MTENRESMVALVNNPKNPVLKWFPNIEEILKFAKYLDENGAVVLKHGKWIDGHCTECGEYATVTNADSIRHMNNDELANFFNERTNVGACNDFGVKHNRECDSNCLECIKEWLQTPVYTV